MTSMPMRHTSNLVFLLVLHAEVGRGPIRLTSAFLFAPCRVGMVPGPSR